jgi:NAD(P)-dependent dehydrogenase (short-subunit alcohol dehydrogenase family)
MKLDGLSAIVTGAASGLGAATASWLAARGVKVGVFDVADEGRNQARAIGGIFCKVDVSNEAQVVNGLIAAEEDDQLRRFASHRRVPPRR